MDKENIEIIKSIKKALINDDRERELKKWMGESVLDPVHKELDQSVWGKDKKIKKEHREYILNKLEKWLEKIGIDKKPDGVYIIGSITTYQYSTISDIDVNVVIDLTKKQIEELIEFLPNESILPGTSHPVNYYLTNDNGASVKRAKTSYDLLNDKWIKEPNKDKVEYPYNYIVEISKIFISGLDERIAEYERDKIEYELFNEYKKNKDLDISSDEIEKALEIKKLELEADLDAIYIGYKLIKSFRREAYEDDYESDFLIDIKFKDSDYSINNLVYKTIERFGYIDKLKTYKKIREEFKKENKNEK